MLTKPERKFAIMTNTEAAHAFFYSDGGFYNRRTPEAFCNDLFFSYSTCIAKKTRTKDGRRILLLSRNKFSSTTSKHIAALKYACYWDIVEVPQQIDRNNFDNDEVLETLYNDLKYAAETNLSLKRNREEFNYNFETLQSLKQVEGFKVDCKLLRKYKATYDKINNPEELAKLKAKQRAAEKRKQERLKIKLNKLIKNNTLAELAKMAYSYESFEEKADLKKYINPNNDLSFVWFDGDLVKTSQGVRVNRQEVEVLIKLWQAGKVKHGMKVAQYTILELTTEFVKIGCHKIPMQNIKELAEIVNNQHQEQKAA